MTTTYYDKYTLPDVAGSPTFQSEATFLNWASHPIGFFDNNGAGSGQLIIVAKVVQEASPLGENFYLYPITVGASTLSAGTPILLSNNTYNDNIECALQTSDGNLHVVWSSGTTYTYTRYSLNYTGTAISGVTQQASFTLFTATVANDSKAFPIEVIANDDTHRLMWLLTNCTAYNTSMTLLICTTALTATAASQITDLAGTANAKTTLTYRAMSPHTHGGSLSQIASTKECLVLYGPTCSEYPAEGASSWWLTPTGTIGWTVGSRVDESDAAPCDVSGLAASSSGIYRAVVDDTNNRIQFAKYTTVGSRTDAVFPNVALGDGAGWVMLQVSPDDATAWFIATTYTGIHLAGRYTGGSWTTQSLTAWTDTYGAASVKHTSGIVNCTCDKIGGTVYKPILSAVIDDTDFGGPSPIPVAWIRA
jgi:hypothetical protein